MLKRSAANSIFLTMETYKIFVTYVIGSRSIKNRIRSKKIDSPSNPKSFGIFVYFRE